MTAGVPGACGLGVSPAPECAGRTLRVLRDCAVAGRGWRRRGVRGWLFTDELPPCAPAALAGRAQHGLVLTDHVPEPGRRPRLALHRITPAGADAVARHEGRPGVGVDVPAGADPADAAVVYLPAGAWVALRALLCVRHTGGWACLAEVRACAAGRAVGPEDLAQLLRRRLAVSARAPGTVPREPGRYFRATPDGAALRLLDLRTGTDDPRSLDRVQATAEPEPRAPPPLVLRYGGQFFGSGG